MSSFNIRPSTAPWFMFSMTLVVLWSSAAAHAQLPSSAPVLARIPGHPAQRVTDLRVKVSGGFVAVKRTRVGDTWKFNPHLAPLRITRRCPGNTSSNCQVNVARGRNQYTLVAGSTPRRYSRRHKTIIATHTGWRWESLDGQWIEYDTDGLTVAFGNRTGLLATLERASDGDDRITGFTDRLGHRVVDFAYDGDHLSRVSDYTTRGVHYTYTGAHLTRVKDVRGEDWHYEYANGQLTSETDPEGRATRYSYSNATYVSSIAFPDSSRLDFEYDYDSRSGQYFVRQKSSGNRLLESWFHPSDGLIRQDLNGRTIYKLRREGSKQIITDEHGNETQLSLDSLNRIIRTRHQDGSTIIRSYLSGSDLPRSVTNERGITTSVDHDARGNVVRITEAAGRPESRVTTLEYDGNNQLVRHTERGVGGAADRESTLAYDDYGNIRALTDAEGNTYTMSHDVLGNIVHLVDPRNRIWQATYDGGGNILLQRDPAGSEIRHTYDKIGRLTKTVDEEGAVTSFAYDEGNRLTRQIDDLTNTWEYEYSADGSVAREVDPSGHSYRYTFDRDGRLASLTDGNGNRTTYTYVPRATISEHVRGLISRAEYPTFTRERRFDARGRLVAEEDVGRDGERVSSSFAYDAAGNLTATTAPDGRTSRVVYDAFDRPIEVVLTDGRVRRAIYDGWGQDVRVVDPGQKVTRLRLDRVGRLIEDIQPGGAQTVLGYDPGGNLTSVITPRNQRVAYSYDEVGRKSNEKWFPSLSAAEPSREIDYRYNRRGDLTGYEDDTSSATYEIDRIGEVETETVDYGPFTARVEYSYYKNGALRSFKAPDGATYRYTYDGNDQLRSIELPDEGTLLLSPYRWLAPSRIVLPGGTVQEYEYDDLLRPTRISSSDPGGTAIMDHRYVWNSAENLSSKTTEHGAYLLTYDSAYRMIGVQHPVLQDEAYAYDDSDNRLPAHSQEQSTWSYGAGNQLLTAGGRVFDYDAAGNRIRDTSQNSTRVLVYDEANRLVRVEGANGETSAEYGYDPFGRRIWKEVAGHRTYFFYTKNGLAAELDSAGTATRTFGYEPGADWSTAPLFLRDGQQYVYYHEDFLGTPQKLTDATGVLRWSAVYSAFGNADVQINETDNPFRLPGQYYDSETGLHYNYFRDYDPLVGRYLQSDPIGVFGGLNRYAYADGDPILNSDKYGLCGPVCIGLAVVIVALTVDSVQDLAEDAGKKYYGDPCVSWTDIGIDIIGLGPPGKVVKAGRAAVKGAKKVGEFLKKVKSGGKKVRPGGSRGGGNSSNTRVGRRGCRSSTSAGGRGESTNTDVPGPGQSTTTPAGSEGTSTSTAGGSGRSSTTTRP